MTCVWDTIPTSTVTKSRRGILSEYDYNVMNSEVEIVHLCLDGTNMQMGIRNFRI